MEYIFYVKLFNLIIKFEENYTEFNIKISKDSYEFIRNSLQITKRFFSKTKKKSEKKKLNKNPQIKKSMNFMTLLDYILKLIHAYLLQ